MNSTLSSHSLPDPRIKSSRLSVASFGESTNTEISDSNSVNSVSSNGSSGGDVVTSGYIEKLAKGIFTRWHTRKYEFRDRAFCWQEDEGGKSKESSKGKVLKYEEILKVEAISEKKFGKKNVLEIITRKKSLYFQAQDQQEYDKIIQHFTSFLAK